MAAGISAIPIQNIYFLLCYAWNRLEQKEAVEIANVDCETLRDLFARVLTSGIEVLHKRGLHREYLAFQEDLSRLRGRIRLGDSIKRFTWQRGQMACEFDELNYDIVHNQILKTSLSLLARSGKLSADSRSRIRNSDLLFREISKIQLTGGIFQRVQYHSNIQHYRFLLGICELIYNATLPLEGEGRHRFRDFLRDKKRMPALFEEFVRNFYKQHAKEYQVGAKIISWNANAEAQRSPFLPQMRTDVTLESEKRKIILDCKFYENTLGGGQYDEKFYSGHLYQLLAYLRNQSIQPGWKDVEGVLLYPAVSREICFDGMLEGHRVRVLTINLDQPWQSIHANLMDILQ